MCKVIQNVKMDADEKCRKNILATEEFGGYSISSAVNRSILRIPERKIIETEVCPVEETSFSLVREFSNLGCYQRQHSIRYAVETAGNRLCLTLQKVQDDETETQRLLLAHLAPEQGRQLVQFMYENAIPMENWKDIMGELVEERGIENGREDFIGCCGRQL